MRCISLNQSACSCVPPGTNMEVKICRNIGLSLPQPIRIIERNGGLTLFLIHISVLAPKSKAPIKNKARSAFWMTN